MPPALDRLLASPSALRLLRAIVNGPEVPAAYLPAASCCRAKITHRHYGTRKRAVPAKLKWRRWYETSEEQAKREAIRQLLEHDGQHVPQDGDKLGAATHGTKAGDGTTGAAAWAESLALRERQDGLKGVKAVWKLMQDAQYNLPCDFTDHADFLWGTFVKHPDLVVEVVEHAAQLLKESKKTYASLYSLVMSHWLPREPRRALEYHRMLKARLELKAIPLKAIVQQGRSSFGPAAYEALMEIYKSRRRRDLYDDVVPALIEKGHVQLARKWHRLCTSCGDIPSEPVAKHPVVLLLTDEASLLANPDPALKDSIRQRERYNTELMQRLLGRDAAPVRFEDSFCARMFATKTFPPESVIRGLAMVGVNEIGPQAVLAMASRTEPLQDLPHIFEELRENGIALQGCVYSLAIEKFATERWWSLVRSMLDSDQHPDVFGDAQVQRKLLDFYLDQEDHMQARRTLAILTLFHRDSSQESWNLLLQFQIRRTGPKHVTEVLQDMRIRGVMLTAESIAAIKGLLRRRQRGRKPTAVHDGYDDLRFVARSFMSILEFGMAPIPPRTWRELIRRFGMSGRLRELRRLLLWLLSWYAPRSSHQFSTLPSSPFLARATETLQAKFPQRSHYFHFPGTTTQRERSDHPIRQLFPPPLQQAFIIWGFRAGLLPNAPLEQSLLGPTLRKKHYRRMLMRHLILKRESWSSGLRTLVLLRDLGVRVHYHTVLKALQMQFTVLFGRGHSRKWENRIMEDVNPIPYSTYVKEVNEIWGSKLLVEPELFQKGMVHDHLWHPRLRRKVDRRGFVRLDGLVRRETGDGAAVRDLEKTFEAQGKALEPGREWMFEADLSTRGVGKSGQ
ncbi:hypothetical protein HBI56_026190 [Parastagonospora nodorum]|nr:hypothetical protein HBH53_033010 [Parastagonospora nodorum]KAH4177510.1 hypothetical protein HBH43_053040 [Parastagonospora nodorum]KAH4200523.1 hypothetical protein HBI95_170790 [Parastagonospora nodorum]KAH4312947.1 hypothetical protein HBI01_009660 [Parastagonospora nodorum]KAH4315914.1 hypothetical protein HBI02_047260 [Parastagonospora nodorum]